MNFSIFVTVEIENFFDKVKRSEAPELVAMKIVGVQSLKPENTPPKKQLEQLEIDRSMIGWDWDGLHGASLGPCSMCDGPRVASLPGPHTHLHNRSFD